MCFTPAAPRIHTHTLLHVYPDLAFNKYLNLPHFQILSLRPHSYIWVLFNHLHPPQPSLHHPAILHFLLFPLLPSSIIPSRSPHPSTSPSSSFFFFPFVSLYRAHLFMHHMTCKAREQAHTDRHTYAQNAIFTFCVWGSGMQIMFLYIWSQKYKQTLLLIKPTHNNSTRCKITSTSNMSLCV